MKAIFTILFFLIGFFAFGQKQITNTVNIDSNMESKINQLKEENDLLSKEINELKIANQSTSSMIDKVDNLYNNNFNRFMVLCTIFGAILTIGVPYYINSAQAKIIDIKKKEIFEFSANELSKLEEKFTTDLSQNIQKLNIEIEDSIEKNNLKLDKEITSSHISSFFIAGKLMEMDNKFPAGLDNLLNAALLSNKIGNFEKVDFFIVRALNLIKKIEEKGVKIKSIELKDVILSAEKLKDIQEISTENVDILLTKLNAGF